MTMASCEASAGDVDEINDPGAAPHGNFINYYTFNPPENRLSLIPATLLKDVGYSDRDQATLILDVGCNSGVCLQDRLSCGTIRSIFNLSTAFGRVFTFKELSVAFYKHLMQNPGGQEAIGSDGTKVHLLGFDLDERLIQRAQETNPLPSVISFIPLDITADDHRLHDYLNQHDCSHFHLTLCLAVTMWVHLNHGDAGLLQLLSRLASISQHLLLEAQPWKCYRSAARRLRKLGRSDFDHFKTLKIRGDISEYARKHLERHCDMELIKSFGSTAWDRKLLLFRRRQDCSEKLDFS